MLRDAESRFSDVLRCSQMFSDVLSSLSPTNELRLQTRSIMEVNCLGFHRERLCSCPGRRQHVEHLSYSPMSEFA